MNHPTGPNTPLVDLSTIAGITQACNTCHATGGASHPFRINLDVTNPNSYPDVNAVCGQCHDGSGKPVHLTPGQLSVFGTNIHYRISPRTATYTWTVDGTVSDKVNFDASSSACGAAPCTYVWNFGDGTIVSAPAVTSHQYPARGSYPAIVTVTDNNGVVSMSPSYNITTMGQNTAPTAVMLAPVVSGMTATISDRSTDAEDAPGAMTVTVNCGNNTVKTGPDHTDLVCTYTTAGTYTIKHSVKDTGGLGSSSANTSVTVGSTSSRYSVSGTLTKQNGTPIGGGYIYLQLAGVNKYIAVTAATTGNFTINNVAPGTYTVKATKTGLTFTTPAESIPSPIVVGSSNVTGVVVKSIQ
jgi:PKD repeat protein